MAYFISKTEYFDEIKNLQNTLCPLINCIPLDIMLIGVHRGGVLPALLTDYYLTAEAKRQKISLTVHTRYISTDIYDKKAFIDSERDFSSLEKDVEVFYNTSPANIKKVYIIDDLLDSGESIKFIHNKLKQWHNQAYIKDIQYKCLFNKSSDKVLEEIKKEVPLEIVSLEKLPTDQWVNFWYEY